MDCDLMRASYRIVGSAETPAVNQQSKHEVYLIFEFNNPSLCLQS